MWYPGWDSEKKKKKKQIKTKEIWIKYGLLIKSISIVIHSLVVTNVPKYHKILTIGDIWWDIRNDAKAETSVLWPSHAKSWLTGKDSDAGRDWRQEEKGTTENEMAGWHHELYGRESEWTPWDGVGQGGLACCDSWGLKESDTTEWLNWTELNWILTDCH